MSSLAASETSVELAQAFLLGTDPTAAERLYNRHRQATLDVAMSRMSERLMARVDPEDIYQSVTLILFRGLQDGSFQLSQAGDLRALLAELTRRRVMKKVEHNSADKRALQREVQLADEQAATTGDHLWDPIEQQDDIERLLSTLTNPRHRSAVCFALAGLTIEQIANKCRYSGARVRQILNDVAKQAIELNS